MHRNKPQDRTIKDETEYNRTTHSKYCKIAFQNDDCNMRKVWHHCHISGKISGKFIAALC